MLAGGSAVLSGLPDALMERSQVPASVISPFKGMENLFQHPREAVEAGRASAANSVRFGNAEV